jgi:hypothetical protein
MQTLKAGVRYFALVFEKLMGTDLFSGTRQHSY